MVMSMATRVVLHVSNTISNVHSNISHDITSVLEHCKYQLYADDTVIYLSDEIQNLVQPDQTYDEHKEDKICNFWSQITG